VADDLALGGRFDTKNETIMF